MVTTKATGLRSIRQRSRLKMANTVFTARHLLLVCPGDHGTGLFHADWLHPPRTYVRPEYSHPSLLAQTGQLIVNAHARPEAAGQTRDQSWFHRI